jgi:hypothetical protein
MVSGARRKWLSSCLLSTDGWHQFFLALVHNLSSLLLIFIVWAQSCSIFVILLVACICYHWNLLSWNNHLGRRALPGWKKDVASTLFHCSFRKSQAQLPSAWWRLFMDPNSATLYATRVMFILFALTVTYYVFDRISNEFQLDQFLPQWEKI